jgi:Uma2 family endonuclease
MNILLQPLRTTGELGQRILLRQIGWDAYEKIVEGLAEAHVRTTYDRGDLEIVSPLPIHEVIKVWFHYFLLALALEVGFPFKSMSQTTFRRRARNRGLEPDDCYYLASAEKVHDWATLNLDRDPPPDLVLEVENTCSCLDRMDVYASLDVPEVWRFDGEEWHVHLLGPNGVYRESPSSAALPYLPIPEIMPLLEQSLSLKDDRELLTILTRWARERVLPLRDAWQQQHQSPPPAANP